MLCRGLSAYLLWQTENLLDDAYLLVSFSGKVVVLLVFKG